MRVNRKIIAALGVVALAVPAVSLAEHKDSHSGGTTKPAQYNVKGVYAGDGVVSVNHVNGHARKAGWRGTDVAFDFSAAQIRVADTNGDGARDLADVGVGDRVKVKARLPKRDPGAGPYVAQRLVDKSSAAGDSEEESSGEEAPAAS